MTNIIHTIHGVPYAKDKSLGNVAGLGVWSKKIIEETRALPKVAGPCVLRVEFRLPPGKFPTDYPYGPDLDNLLKRLMDGLNETIFSAVAGKDSCVVHLMAKKVRVLSEAEAGARIEIQPATLS